MASANLATRVTVGQINRAAFFSVVRRSGVAGHPLRQASVVSLEAILDAWAKELPKGLDLRWIAYTMATARHEAWHPREQAIKHNIEEFGGASRGYGRTGFFGRGMVQITHQANYERAGRHFGVDLVGNPDLALRPDISAGCLVIGSLEGWYRGDARGRHKLSRYFSETADDPVNARNIINGDVGKNGRLIAQHHAAFLRALREALTASDQPQPIPMPAPTPTPVEPPMPIPAPSPSVEPVLPPKPWWQSRVIIVNILTAIAATPFGAKYLGGYDISQTVETLSAIATVVLPLVSSYFRGQTVRAISGTQTARDTEARLGAVVAAAEARVPLGYGPVHEAWASEQPAQPSGMDLMSLPLTVIVEQLPSIIQVLRQVNHATALTVEHQGESGRVMESNP